MRQMKVISYEMFLQTNQHVATTRRRVRRLLRSLATTESREPTAVRRAQSSILEYQV